MYLSRLFNNISESDGRMECVLSLVHCPFEFAMPGSKNVVLWEFCNNFMCPAIANNVKNVLIPYLKSKRDFPYEDLIQYLYEHRSCETSNSLFYSLLALEPDDFEPTKCSLQVIAMLTANIHKLKPEFIPIADDSDNEDEIFMSLEQQLTEDYIHLINNANRVKKIVLFFDRNSNDEEVLISLMHLCHNLLLVYKDSIRKYM